MALTKISGDLVKVGTGLSVGVVTATTVQVGSATTIHTTGIDLGSGSINSHNINSTGIITATSFFGDGSNLTGLTKTLTIGVRTGAALTTNITGSSFNVYDRNSNPVSISI